MLDTVQGASGYVIDSSSDGSVSVARNDGILHIGPGGYVVPPDQYGHARCGGPKISDSLPAQHIGSTHQLEVLASCVEACSLISAAAMTAQGSRTTYTLAAPLEATAQAADSTCGCDSASPRTARWLNAHNHHRTGNVQLLMGSIDAGDVRAYFRQTVIGPVNPWVEM